MADRCLCHAYFEGVYDKQIKQGQDFDLAQGVRAIDGYGNEVDFTYEPTEIDLCKTGDQEVTYKAFGASFNVIPKLCMPKYKKGVSIPEACPSDLEMITAKRTIRIIRASNPRFLGIPRVTITENEAFDPTEGVTAVDDNGNPITDIEYSGYLDKRVTGNPITIPDGQSIIPVESLKVTLEPIQDLNGYDKPWAGGAGKNKLHNTATSVTKDGITFTVNSDGTVKVNGTATTNTELVLTTNAISENGDYLINGCPSGSSNSTYWLNFKITANGASFWAQDYGNGYSLSNGTIQNFTVFVKSGATVNNAVFKPMIRLASETDATYEPYSNICPIEGHTEVVTHRTGINVWDEDWEVGGLYGSAGTNNNGNTSVMRSKNYIEVLPSTTYYLYNGTVSDAITLCQYDENKSFISSVYPQMNRTITVGENVHYVRFATSGSYGNTYKNDISINYPSTDHDYHAYDGDTYTTSLGQTVYGGTLDVVSGELVVDRAYVDLGTLEWTYSGGFFRLSNLRNFKRPPNNSTVTTAISSAYTAMSWNAIQRTSNGAFAISGGSDNPIFCITAYSDVSAFKTAMSGVQLVYELATPQTIQLTPQQIELLKGTNNVWSDEGDVRVIYEGNIPQDGSFEYPLEGEYTITYKATDKCGNEGTAERTIVVTPSE